MSGSQPTDYQVRVGTYKGRVHQLKGLTANCWCYPTGVCLALFDRQDSGYADTRHQFNTADFDLDVPVDFSGGEDLA
jgi:hypothetical protein